MNHQSRLTAHLRRNPLRPRLGLCHALWLTFAFAACILGAGLAGCAGSRAGSQAEAPARYVFVYLKNGPRSGSGTPDERKAMFAGHMANIGRLADDGKLLVAGPFNKPRDTTWRGIFVLNVSTVDEARALGETDPGVIAGEFTLECRPMDAPAWLGGALEAYKVWKEEAAKATEPPKEVRPYVMITAADGRRAERALQDSQWAGKIVWSGRFTDTGQGVFVIDATEAEEVRKGLESVDVGEHGVDGWYSAESLMRLRATKAAGTGESK